MAEPDADELRRLLAEKEKKLKEKDEDLEKSRRQVNGLQKKVSCKGKLLGRF